MWNEIAGWTAILMGVVLGLYMGIRFQSDDWLGGYNALPRRMVRLAHIALVALGMLNILAANTLSRSPLTSAVVLTASWTLIAGALTMPACCLWIAAGSRRFGLFAVPVVCLVAGLILTIGGLAR